MTIITDLCNVYVVHGDEQLTLSRELFLDRKFTAIGQAIASLIEPEEKIVVTKHQLQAAYNKACFPILNPVVGFTDYSCRIDVLMKELGFKN